ncbi:NAD(P)-dependent oxidoreductase [Patulibacter americanus]|uniref:NAD(P)-dependent oxidoreductase n=1 Tax=Patulibacter americanus TaxID=588672 RepID=UPI0003B3CAEF|nr:NAD(P)H-binding protein [Patulibacter americanus]
MRISIIGAAGHVGRRVTAEAAARGHDVTAVARDTTRLGDLPAGVTARAGDAGDATFVAALAADHDVVVLAIRPGPGREGGLADTTRGVLRALDGLTARLLVVGGAGGLTVSGTSTRVVDDPRFVPTAWRDIALGSVAQLDACRASVGVDWSVVCPPAILEPGERTGQYRLGGSELLMDADGVSRIATEDLAVALLDEAEHPRHRRGSFTVAAR